MWSSTANRPDRHSAPFRKGWRRFAAAVLILFACACAGPQAWAQASPFGVPAPGAPAARPAPAPEAGGPYDRFMRRIFAWQQVLHGKLTGAVKALKDGRSLAAAWALASLSFFYGVVHAVGPGHGKAVISSYVLANGETVRRGIVLSFLSSAAQAVSAVLMVGVLAIMLGMAGLQIRQFTGQLESASYLLVAVIGAWLLASFLMRRFRGHGAAAAQPHAGTQHDHGHHHGHAHHEDECCGHAHILEPGQLRGPLSWRKTAAIVLAVGIRPCTGAIVVLVFALANGIFLTGVAATFAMALGTAITVSLLAAAAAGSRQLAAHMASGSLWIDAVHDGAALAGSLLILVMGTTLFLGSLYPSTPF